MKDRLNAELSNAPWSDKTTILGDHTVLLLNRRLLKDYASERSEATIAARGAELAARVLPLWPRP